MLVHQCFGDCEAFTLHRVLSYLVHCENCRQRPLGHDVVEMILFPLKSRQPRSQGLSSLPPLVIGTETLVAAGHVTAQNLGGIKICWKGGATWFPLDQMYLSTHPPGGFGWIDGHVTSRNQGLCSNDLGGQRRETLGTRLKSRHSLAVTYKSLCLCWIFAPMCEFSRT